MRHFFHPCHEEDLFLVPLPEEVEADTGSVLAHGKRDRQRVIDVESKESSLFLNRNLVLFMFPSLPDVLNLPKRSGKDPRRVHLGGVRWNKRETICSGSLLHPDARAFRCNFEDPGISHARNHPLQDDKRASKQTGSRNESPLERSSAPCLTTSFKKLTSET